MIPARFRQATSTPCCSSPAPVMREWVDGAAVAGGDETGSWGRPGCFAAGARSEPGRQSGRHGPGEAVRRIGHGYRHFGPACSHVGPLIDRCFVEGVREGCDDSVGARAVAEVVGHGGGLLVADSCFDDRRLEVPRSRNCFFEFTLVWLTSFGLASSSDRHSESVAIGTFAVIGSIALSMLGLSPPALWEPLMLGQLSAVVAVVVGVC